MISTNQTNTKGYNTYLMLMHLQGRGFFVEETEDERWDIALHHLNQFFINSVYDDTTKSTYECIEDYAKSVVPTINKEGTSMSKLDKLQATVVELAETVKHTVDEQSALCMRVNLLEESGMIESPSINGRLVRLQKTADGFGVDVLDAESYAVLEAFHFTMMGDAMRDYQVRLRSIREMYIYANDINNSSDLAIAVANDEVVHPSSPKIMHFISSCGEVYVNADGTINAVSYTHLTLPMILLV